ncbi:hypothetical protein RhiLY_04723 [Ceratobasidium sp. AG-Ba]|nr:hypothetical protein RhiLY_04723 [Ceratobasidium sp. AG-Ba]
MLACHPHPADRDARHHASPGPSAPAPRHSLCTVAQNIATWLLPLVWPPLRHRTPSPYPESAAQLLPGPICRVHIRPARDDPSQPVGHHPRPPLHLHPQAGQPVDPRAARERVPAAVTALMLANKFLDDNTYNKTWSDVSRISLSEINQMEKRVSQRPQPHLYVDLATYESWSAC